MSGGLVGAVCWYSITHTPADELRRVLVEVARVLAGGAPLLVAFQTADDDDVHRADAHGSGLPLTSFRHHVDTVVDALARASFDVASPSFASPQRPTSRRRRPSSWCAALRIRRRRRRTSAGWRRRRAPHGDDRSEGR